MAVYEEPADPYAEDFVALNQLRTSALAAFPNDTGRAALRAYASQLDGVQPRLELPGIAKRLDIVFAWTDTLRPGATSAQNSSFNFERANILYNMAAVEIVMTSSKVLLILIL